MDPLIAVVIYGAADIQALAETVNSVTEAQYPDELIRLYYVVGPEGFDPGSGNPAWNLTVVPFTLAAGFMRGEDRALSGVLAGEWFQFMEAGSRLDRDWFKNAVSVLSDPAVGAVFGRNRTTIQGRHYYNDGPVRWEPSGSGSPLWWGRSIFISKPVWEASYRPEDGTFWVSFGIEQFCRVLSSGTKISQLNADMALRDQRKRSIGKFWGHFAGIGKKMASASLGFSPWCQEEIDEVVVRNGFLLLGLCILPLGLIQLWFLVGSVIAGIMVFQPWVARYKVRAPISGSSQKAGEFSSWYDTLSIIPRFFGMTGFWWGRLFELLGPSTKKKLDRKGISHEN